MKKILLSSLIFILLISCGADWVVVYKDSKTGFVYVDKNSIKKTNEGIYFWSITDLNSPWNDVKGKVRSIKASLLIDCSNRKFKWIETLFYSGDMGTGTIIDKTTENLWDTINPNTPPMGFFNYICLNKKN